MLWSNQTYYHHSTLKCSKTFYFSVTYWKEDTIWIFRKNSKSQTAVEGDVLCFQTLDINTEAEFLVQNWIQNKRRAKISRFLQPGESQEETTVNPRLSANFGHPPQIYRDLLLKHPRLRGGRK